MRGGPLVGDNLVIQNHEALAHTTSWVAKNMPLTRHLYL